LKGFYSTMPTSTWSKSSTKRGVVEQIWSRYIGEVCQPLSDEEKGNVTENTLSKVLSMRAGKVFGTGIEMDSI